MNPVVRFWGTRGSIPSPGPATARFGGNTSCVEVRVGGQHFILDCGSGARRLGQELAEAGDPVDATILFTHFHWDHIQGFPFFQPLYESQNALRVVGPQQGSVDVQSLFAGQMAPIYFPVPFERISASCEFQHLSEGPAMHFGDVEVRAMRVCHPSHTVGYRLDWEGHAMAYIPDNELLGEGDDMAPNWREELIEFLSGVDLLIHDAMYTEAEYPERAGWGHSTYRQALELAHKAGAGRLVFFHHDPDRTDQELDGIMARATDYTVSEGIKMKLAVAEEGSKLSF